MPVKVQMIQPSPIKLPEITRMVDFALIEIGHSVVMPAMANATYGWSDEPTWKEIGPRTKDGAREWIYQTTDTPFLWVDEGTEGPYPIPKSPKPPGSPLRFQTDYRPRTTPGAPFSGGPGVAMGPWRSAHQVMHPGIEARNFTGMAAETSDSKLPREMQRALDKVGSI
jgi:hypothetical protein